MTLGVVGAGTMGAGIAQLGCQAGEETLLLDADPGALERARERIAKRLDAEQLGRLRLVGDVAELAGCDVVIEAVPEDLALKHRVFGDVAAVVGEDCVLATNTSSLPVTQVAAGVPVAARVVGMHFFNPAPVMRLVEVIAGVDSAEWALDRVRALGAAMGRTVIDAADGPGFLVNRCNRPFGLEALRCLQDGIADVETIDRIVRMGGGFRMGPFELVGPRRHRRGLRGREVLPRAVVRRAPLAPVAAPGADGGERPPRPQDRAAGGTSTATAPTAPTTPSRPTPAQRARRGTARPRRDRRRRPPRRRAVRARGRRGVGRPRGRRRARRRPLARDRLRPRGGRSAARGRAAARCSATSASLATLDGDGPAAGFHALPPLADARLVEMTRGPYTAAAAAERGEHFFATLGKHVAWVGDAPGLVLGRIVCQLVNEAAFALGEGVGGAEDIDAGMVLGMNHPRGPLEWADLIGLEHVVAVLAGLQAETGEERYRVAPELRRRLALGLTFRGDPSLD